MYSMTISNDFLNLYFNHGGMTIYRDIELDAPLLCLLLYAVIISAQQ